MTSASGSVKSTDVVLYHPPLRPISKRAHLEEYINGIYRRSLEIAKFESSHLLPKWKERVVTGVAAGVSHLYVIPIKGKRMASVVMQNLRSGNYDAYPNPTALNQAILQDLQSVYKDKHLSFINFERPLNCSPFRSLRTIKEEDFTLEQRKYVDTTFRQANPSKRVESEILPGSQIGYVRIDAFNSSDFPETKQTIDALMKHVANTEALIIDLRYNNGGSSKTVALVASHLFNEKTALSQTYQPSTDQATLSDADPKPLGPIFGGEKPIYILTSERTFSAGEALAYDLQSYNRAKVIGQITGGGAHPVRPFTIDDHTTMQIPFEKAINPNTGINWEGVGVKPDYEIPKDEDGLAFARALIESQPND